jgi:hypothetical protein
VLSLGDDYAFDSLVRNTVEPDREQGAGGVDDLDLLPHSRPQRAGEVAGVAAGDDGAPTFTLCEERRQKSADPGYIMLRVS